MNLSSKFEEALQYAVIVHAGQIRKGFRGRNIPYISRLLGVASIAMEYGANENETIGAILHDVCEDSGEDGRIKDIRKRFGDSVAEIVRVCNIAVTVPKPPWRQRKEKFIANFARASKSVCIVAASYELHNARSIVRDFRIHGDSVWSRLNAGMDETIWFYRSLIAAFPLSEDKDRMEELIKEFDLIVAEIERLAGVPHCPGPVPTTYFWKGKEYPMGTVQTGQGDPTEQAEFMETQPGYKEWSAERGRRLMGQVKARMQDEV